MYSKNDYRNYLEHRLAESDDYFAHYGVKGMKWKQHIYAKKYENEEDPGTNIYEVGNKKTGKYVQAMHFKDKRYGSSIRVNTNAKKNKSGKMSTKKIGKRITKDVWGDGSTGYTVDLSTRKQRRRAAANDAGFRTGFAIESGVYQAKKNKGKKK